MSKKTTAKKKDRAKRVARAKKKATERAPRAEPRTVDPHTGEGVRELFEGTYPLDDGHLE